MSDTQHEQSQSADVQHVEGMPSILETVPPPAEHQFPRGTEGDSAEGSTPPADTNTEQNTASGNIRKAVAIGVGVATVAGGAFALGANSGGEDEPSAPAVSTPNSEPTPPLGEDPTQTTIDVEVTTPEVELSQFTPEPMIADTPFGLVEGLYHNYNCALNTDDLEIKRECVRLISGDPDNRIGQVFMESALQATEDRRTNPDLTFDPLLTLIDSQVSEDNIQVVVMVQGVSEIYYKHYSFRPAITVGGAINIDEDGTDTWVLTGTRTVEPGEVTFDE